MQITAAKPLINRVAPLTHPKTPHLDVDIITLNRIIKKTPAVTSVDEWTSEDTGVGAAIASGSQVQ